MASTKKLIEIAKKGDATQLNKMLEDEKVRALKRALRTAMRDDDFEAMAAIQTVVDKLEPKKVKTKKVDADATLVRVSRTPEASQKIYDMVVLKASRKGKTIRQTSNSSTFAIKDSKSAESLIKSVTNAKLKGIKAELDK